MKKAGKISEEFVKKLRPPEQGQRIYWDDKTDGFGVRVNSGGSIAFVLNYTLNKKRRRFNVGRYPELSATAARTRTEKLRVDLLDGKDPMQAKWQNDTDPTFKELAERYLEKAETYKRPGSLRNDRGNIKRLLVQWATRPVKSYTQRDIEKLKTDLKATPYHANRTLALLSTMFNLAVKQGWRIDNPVKGVVKFHEDMRERWLSQEEIALLLLACDSYPDQNAADAIRLLLLTGSREGEVLKADWTQFDLKRGLWTKPSHHTKQKKIEHVPLSQQALALLKRIGPKKTGPLFPGRVGFEAASGTRVTLRRPWAQLCKAAGLSQAVERKGKRRMITRHKPTVRIHDLRHTFASHLASNGVPIQVVQKLIGHTNVVTTQRYAHLANKPLQEAANLFGNIFEAAGEKQ
jgi:integrase